MSDHDDLLAQADHIANAPSWSVAWWLVQQTIRLLAAALRAVTAERDALRAVVRRFGPPPGTLLLPQDEADAFRRALEDTP